MVNRKKAKPKSESRRVQASVSNVSLDEVPPLGPWAAYTIGHNCQFIRAFQLQFWETAESVRRIDQVPSTLDEITDGLRVISSRITEDQRKGLSSACGAMRRVYPRLPFMKVGREGQWQDFLAESSQGYVQWNRMVRRSGELFHKNDPLRDWFELGSGLGQFQVIMFLKGNLATPGKDPSLRPVFNAAVRLFDRRWRGALEVEELATYKLYKSWMPMQKIMATIVDTSDATVDYKTASGQVNTLITEQACELDSLIRKSLFARQAARIGVTSNPEARLGTPRITKLYTPLQFGILDALNGTALHQKGLARRLGLDIGGRALHRKGGITELMEEGVVIQQDGVGYFRPDAPPPDQIPLTQRTS